MTYDPTQCILKYEHIKLSHDMPNPIENYLIGHLNQFIEASKMRPGM